MCYKKFHFKWQAVQNDKENKKAIMQKMKLYQQTWQNHYNNQGSNNNKGV